MDDAKRRELEARRAAQKQRANEPSAEGAIVRRLARCGVPHDITNEGIWTPAYLPVTAIRVYWEGAPDPARSEYCETYRERIDTIRSMIEQVAQPEDVLRFSYDTGFESNFTILMRAAVRKGVLAILLNSRQTIWITSHPSQWLIEWGKYNTAQLATPPAGFDEEQAGRDAAWLAPLTDVLRRKAIPSTVTPAYNPNGPKPSSVAYELSRKGWSGVERSLSAGIELGGASSLRAMLKLGELLKPYLAARIDGTAAVVVAPVGRGAPVIQLPREGLIDAMSGLVRLVGYHDPDAPGGPIDVRTVWLYADGGDWLVELTSDGRYLRVNALG